MDRAITLERGKVVELRRQPSLVAAAPVPASPPAAAAPAADQA
jgi:hypothetical protein